MRAFLVLELVEDSGKRRRAMNDLANHRRGASGQLGGSRGISGFSQRHVCEIHKLASGAIRPANAQLPAIEQGACTPPAGRLCSGGLLGPISVMLRAI
jgi:hypothetical protein